MIQVYTLENICDIKSGGTPSRFDLTNYGGDIPWAKISDIEACNGTLNLTEETISEKGLRAIHNRVFKKGTLLFAMYGSVGKMAFAGKDLTTNQAILGISIKDTTKLFDRYLYYWLFRQKEQFLAQANGVSQKNLSATFVRNLSIPLPPLEEQKRIAAILDKADAIRRKRKEAIALTEELLRSTFLDMFGDPVTNPKGWEVALFDSVGKLDRGKSKHRPRNDLSLLGGKYPLIQTGDVANSKGLIQEYSQTYSDKGLAQSKMWSAGTLCITIAANIAQTGILAFDSCFPDSIVGFIPNKKVTTEYIQVWLGFLQPLLEKRAPQSAQKNINLQILRKLDVPVPPIKMQQSFSDFVLRTRSNALNYEKSRKITEELFNSLLQKAFSGVL